MNIKRAYELLSQLANQGVQTVCVCPGARNAPFIEILSKQNYFEVLSFYDERSAGFFALGRARRDNKPVAVLVTSGTAVSELLSPVVEAYYSNTPLVVLSSDRPKRLRGTGAPQTIHQNNIFGNFVNNSWDIDGQGINSIDLSNRKPVHINMCFDEPLVDQLKEAYSFSTSISSGLQDSKLSEIKFKKQVLEKTVVVVGALKASDRPAVADYLANLNVPIYLEALSGLRGVKSLQDKTLISGEKVVSKLFKSGEVQSVLRLGDIPVGRYWRDLDTLDLHTLSVSDKEFSGTEKSQLAITELQSINELAIEVVDWDWSRWKTIDQQKKHSIEQLLERNPSSEMALFKTLIDKIPKEESVYIGNSLPIRHWDLLSANQVNAFASRGVNGIDGQLSTALGLAQPNSTLWVVLGDLTSLYDFSGFWVTPYLRQQKIQVNLVVVNNHGGQIFDRIFDNPLFKNEHHLNFKPVAQMWGWEYFDDIPDSFTECLNLVELKVDNSQSTEFWKGYDQLWKNE